MRFCIQLILAILVILPQTAQAEFIVKYHIDGHIYVPPGPTGADAACIAEMDGDPSSPEILVFRGDGDHGYEEVGIADVGTGVTQWLSISDVGNQPLQLILYAGAYGISATNVPPFFKDVDSDGLMDVLVPARYGGDHMTAVIGWDGAAAASEAPLRNVARLSLAQPNPSGSSVAFEYFIPKRSHLEFRVLDVAGRLVRTLIDADVEAGPHSIAWDGFTNDGREAAVGSYFFVLKVNGVQVAERSSVLVR